MPTYQRFEDLPAWNAATEVAVETFRLTEAASFRFKTRRIYEEDRKAADFQTRLAAYRAAMEQQLRDGTFHTPDAEPLPSLFPAKPAAEPPSVAPEPKSAAPAAMPPSPAAASGMTKTSAPAAAPSCPLCGRTMVLRPSRSGANFWGCPAYPQCKGHRNAT